MEIDCQALTTGEVAKDGEAISFGFVDTTSNPATIRLSLNQVSALAMTLRGLIDKALQTRFGDQSLRYATRSRHGSSSNRPIRRKTWSRCVRWTDLASAFPSHTSSRLNSARRWWCSSRRR
jgi:hypothetical protein